MTGLAAGKTRLSDRSTMFGGDGSILVEVRRNGVPEANNRVVLFLRLGRIPVASEITDSNGQINFQHLLTSILFTAVAYDLNGTTAGATNTDIQPAVSPSETILDFAGQGAAGSNMATVSLVLRDRDDALRTNLTGLRWAFFDNPQPEDFVSVVDKGEGATTDGSGNFQVTINNTTLENGETGFIVISNTDGNAGNQSIAHAAPVDVVVS